MWSTAALIVKVYNQWNVFWSEVWNQVVVQLLQYLNKVFTLRCSGLIYEHGYSSSARDIFVQYDDV